MSEKIQIQESKNKKENKKINNNNNNIKKNGKKKIEKEQGKGLVKAVLSGNVILVVDLSKNQNGPPLEREITLTNIKAPRLGGKKKNQKKNNEKNANITIEDEPWAWPSREFLRKKCVGKQVAYVIEYKVPDKNKEYGSVYLIDQNGENENLSKIIVSEGWAEVRKPNQYIDNRPDLQELVQAEERAKEEGKGIFNKSQKPFIRPTIELKPEQFTSLFEQLRKENPLSGIVEQVKTGSSFRIILPSSFYNIPLILSGVECPDFPINGHPEKFAREAKYFTEHYILHRDVQIILESVDKFTFYGTILYSNYNIGEELLKNGLARYVEWSGQKCAFSEQLKNAEKNAKEKKLRIWQNYIEPKYTNKKEEKKQPRIGKEITGKVIKIIHAGHIQIVDAIGNEHDIFLSSIKIPRQGNTLVGKKESRRDAKERSCVWEGKEYIRKRLIGQRVKAVLDYIKDIFKKDEQQQKQNAKGNQVETRCFYSVYIDKNNVAVELVDRGYAEAQQHRGNDLRSKDYEDILFAEQRAKKLTKGIWCPDDKAPIIHINDLSMDSDKAKQFLNFFKRAGKVRGIVDHIFSGGRLKLYVPKEQAILNFSLHAIRVPRINDEFGEQARQFTINKCLQHDIEFEVTSTDKGGNFIGNLWISREENLATKLLEEGLASIHQATLRDSPYSTEYSIAEDSAKKAKKKIWENYDEQAEEEKRRQKSEEFNEKNKLKKPEIINVVVTEIIDATKFYIQIINKETEQLEELMKNLSIVDDNNESYKPKIGELVKAQFSVDNEWYRAKVLEEVDGEYSIIYIDYGNETIPSNKIRKLHPNFNTQKLRPQAYEAQLAYIIPPKLSDDYGLEAAELLKELVWDKKLVATVEYKENVGTENEKLFLSLGNHESENYVNCALLRNGLAKVEKVKSKYLKSIIEKLKEEEEKAKSEHLSIWEYGDPGSDEDEPKKKKK